MHLSNWGDTPYKLLGTPLLSINVILDDNDADHELLVSPIHPLEVTEKKDRDS